MGNDNNSSKNSIFLAFVLGSLVGMTIGMLYAPKSGKETRKNIKKFSDEVKDTISNLSDDLKDASSKLCEK
ncbi:MAG: YtxH domain-containing protein [Endomicrobium sp.]|jgi:gas vesicle protein|nr:YtxH domain-containing protein [Endomicrobium sp.]